MYLFVMLVALLTFSGRVVATTCAPFQENYYVSCNDGKCSGAYRVSDVDSFGTCGRRSVVDNGDLKVFSFVANLIRASQGEHSTGFYEVKFEFLTTYRDVLDQSYDSFERRLVYDVLIFMRLTEPFPWSISELKSAELVDSFNKHYGTDWLTKLSADTSDSVIAMHKNEANQRQSDEQFSDSLNKTAFWISQIAATIFLAYSVHLFFRRLYVENASRARYRFLFPLALQGGAVFVIVVGGLFASLDFARTLLLYSPAILVVWTAQCWAFIRQRAAR